MNPSKTALAAMREEIRGGDAASIDVDERVRRALAEWERRLARSRCSHG